MRAGTDPESGAGSFQGRQSSPECCFRQAVCDAWVFVDPDVMFWAGSAVLIAGLAVLIIFYLKHRRRHAGFIALETTNTAQERPV